MEFEEGRSAMFLWRVYKLPIILGSLSCLLILCSIILLFKSTTTVEPIQFLDRQGNVLGDISNHASESARLSEIRVDVEGAIFSPGVVTIPQGSRVEDAIVAAGGLRDDADTRYIAQSINKAMKVVDGMKLYIPTIQETSHNGDCTTFSGNTNVAQSCGIVATLGKSSQNAASVSINLASKDQLDTLPGVGPVTAQKIIDNRPYQTLEELVSKKAVGQAVFEKIKGLVSL